MFGAVTASHQMTLMKWMLIFVGSWSAELSGWPEV
jgi:hypothetical protein